MLTQEPTIPICPDCGTRLEGGFSRSLGRCMICLLRVGFDDAEEPNEAPLSSVADRLGNYRIERHDDGTPWELGRGAMGVTYRAVDTSLQRPVALKLIDSEWVKRGAEARERFMREARAAAALRHPNVATVYHFGIREENGQCFCAMELVEGETLEMRVRRTGPLDALDDHRHRAPGQQRAGRSGKAGPGAPGFEAGEFDVRRRRVQETQRDSHSSGRMRRRRRHPS